MLYYPSHEKYYDPARFFLEPKNLWIDSSDQQKIHAWYFESKTQPSLGTFVFFHGNAENLSSHFAMMSWLPFSGYNYIIFDYPGYGETLGTPTEYNTVEAGKSVIRYVYKNLDPNPLIIYGQSLGGIIALRSIQELKNEIPLKAAVIDGSFNSYRRAGRRALAHSWITWIFQPLGYLLISNEKAPDSLAELSPLPLIFLHGDNDRVIDEVFSHEMFEESKESKRLWIVHGGRHGSSFVSENRLYRKKLTDFLEYCLPPAINAEKAADERCR